MTTSEAVKALTSDQLKSALKSVGRTNDMLPPREDDKVADRIAHRFIEGLHARTSSGQYRCGAADFVPVPKRHLTTRPAAVLALQDRIVYEALVGSARPKISKHLISDRTVLWPRADESKPDWEQFERLPMSSKDGYVVSADIAGFYESIDHRRLSLILADIGVSKIIREGIEQQLNELMRNSRGIPQGVETSNSIATAYLSSVDNSLQRAGLKFWRHGDDYRIWVKSYADALAATFQIEQSARSSGLLLNAGKLHVETLKDYTKKRNDIDESSALFRERMRSAREKALSEASEEELVEAAEKAEVDEDMQWRYFYHGTASLDEFLSALAPSLTPGPIEVVTEMLDDLMRNENGEKLPPGLGHARLTFCIRRLARAKSPAALPWLSELLMKKADEVQDLSNYMLALINSEPEKVVSACQYALTNKGHMLDWERAWIYRVLSRQADLVHANILKKSTTNCRIRCVKLAGTSGSSSIVSQSETINPKHRYAGCTEITRMLQRRYCGDNCND